MGSVNASYIELLDIAGKGSEGQGFCWTTGCKMNINLTKPREFSLDEVEQFAILLYDKKGNLVDRFLRIEKKIISKSFSKEDIYGIIEKQKFCLSDDFYLNMSKNYAICYNETKSLNETKNIIWEKEYRSASLIDKYIYYDSYEKISVTNITERNYEYVEISEDEIKDWMLNGFLNTSIEIRLTLYELKHEAIDIVIIYPYEYGIRPYNEYAWLNASFGARLLMDCSNISYTYDQKIPIIVNGSNGIDNLNGSCGKMIIYTYCAGNDTALYHSDCEHWIIGNDTNQLPHLIEIGVGENYEEKQIVALMNGSYFFNRTSPLDNSNSSAHMTGFGNPSRVYNYIGYGLEYDGNDYHVYNGLPNILNHDFTLEFMMNNSVDYNTRSGILDLNALGYCYCGTDTVGIGCDDDAFCCAVYSAGDGWSYANIPSGDIDAGVWYHVAFTFNNSRNAVDIYLNGVLKDNDPHNTIDALTDNNAYGCHADNGGGFQDYWIGDADNFRVWSVALDNESLDIIYKNINNQEPYGMIASYEEYTTTSTTSTLTTSTTSTTSTIEETTTTSTIKPTEVSHRVCFILLDMKNVFKNRDIFLFQNNTYNMSLNFSEPICLENGTYDVVITPSQTDVITNLASKDWLRYSMWIMPMLLFVIIIFFLRKISNKK